MFFPCTGHAGVINLKSCTEVKEREPIKGHKFAFDICTEERVYHLASETEQERQEWLETLNTLLFVEPRHQVRMGSYERLRQTCLHAQTQLTAKSLLCRL